MLESILYFLLGFLAAALLALMVSPIIWGRAVALTKRRIERSVPLTLNEIQADKDQLRAEFAMSTRRLEMSVDELRERASTQIIEINRRRDDVARLAEEQGEKVHFIEELQAKSGELRVQLRQREEQLEKTSSKLEDTMEKMDEKALHLEQMQQNFHKAKTDSDSSKIELVAKQTQLDNVTDELDAKKSVEELDAEGGGSKKLKSELSKTKQLLKAEIRNAKALEKKLDGSDKQLNANIERLENRERELSRMRQSDTQEGVTNSQLTSQLVDQQSLNVELEAKLAHSSLQMEALLSDASNDNVEKAMTSLEQEKSSLAEQLKKAKSERDKFEDALSNVTDNRREEWDSERRENSILRERMNDLAAQVTAMTAALEGDKSPINEILARQGNTNPTRGKKAANAPLTLADRIRALQDAAG